MVLFGVRQYGFWSVLMGIEGESSQFLYCFWFSASVQASRGRQAKRVVSLNAHEVITLCHTISYISKVSSLTNCLLCHVSTLVRFLSTLRHGKKDSFLTLRRWVNMLIIDSKTCSLLIVGNQNVIFDIKMSISVFNQNIR